MDNYIHISQIKIIDFGIIYMYIIDRNVRFDEEKRL